MTGLNTSILKDSTVAQISATVYYQAHVMAKLTSNKNFQNNIIITKERIGEDRYYNISSKKIRKELSWKEEFSLDLGLTLTYKWVYDNFNFLKNQKLIYFHKK